MSLDIREDSRRDWHNYQETSGEKGKTRLLFFWFWSSVLFPISLQTKTIDRIKKVSKNSWEEPTMWEVGVCTRTWVQCPISVTVLAQCVAELGRPSWLSLLDEFGNLGVKLSLKVRHLKKDESSLKKHSAMGCYYCWGNSKPSQRLVWNDFI